MYFIQQIKTLCILLCLFGANFIYGQNGQALSAGARGAGMGNTGIGFQDVNSVFGNQAGLASLQQTSFMAFGESRFVGFGIRSVGAAAAIPANAGTFGLALQYFGLEEYNEQKVGLAYARKLFEKFSVGVQFDYLRLRAQDFGSRGLFTFEAGIQSQLTKKLVIGFYTYSPVRVNIIEDEDLPTIFKFGGALKVSPKLTIAAELEKDIDFPMEFHLGLEYAILQAFFLRVGVQTEPSELSIGFGYQWKEQLQFDIAATYHQFLGITPAFSMTYLIPKGSKK